MICCLIAGALFVFCGLVFDGGWFPQVWVFDMVLGLALDFGCFDLENLFCGFDFVGWLCVARLVCLMVVGAGGFVVCGVL